MRMVTIRKILIPAALVIAAWTLVAAISATAEYMAIQSEEREIEWLSTFFSHLPMWYLWALLTPFSEPTRGANRCW